MGVVGDDNNDESPTLRWLLADGQCEALKKEKNSSFNSYTKTKYYSNLRFSFKKISF